MLRRLFSTRACLRVAIQESVVEKKLRQERLSDEDKRQLRGHFSFTNANSLKLVIPLPSQEVVAFLLHTQQPLSYLETLIKAELEADSRSDSPTQIKFLDVAKNAKWNTAIQVSEFIREAAATKAFTIDIDGSRISVNVPSFEDRTQFLRAQLGRVTAALQTEHNIKLECDSLAAQMARRYAVYGAAVLVSYWGVVLDLTFFTDLGWDVMEPITYLTGLSGIIVGYGWFLYHNRDVSYSSVLHTTATIRQQRLYKEKGFDLVKYRDLIEDGKQLRKEIKAIASEYSVAWSEAEDKHISDSDGEATKVLMKEHSKDETRRKTKREEDEEDDGEINGSNESPPTKRR